MVSVPEKKSSTEKIIGLGGTRLHLVKGYSLGEWGTYCLYFCNVYKRILQGGLSYLPLPFVPGGELQCKHCHLLLEGQEISQVRRVLA